MRWLRFTRGGRESEPDALDRWFAMQRRAWWKRWRWAAVLLMALAFFRTAYVGVNGLLICLWLLSPAEVKTNPPFWAIALNYYQVRLCTEVRVSAWLLAACAPMIIAAQARAFSVPSELALTCAPMHVYKRWLARVTASAWAWTAGLVYSSVAIGYLGFLAVVITEGKIGLVPFPLDPGLLHVQPLLAAALVVYLTARLPRLHYAVVALVALLPAAADIWSRLLSQNSDEFWPISALLDSSFRLPPTYNWILFIELAAAIWLGFAAAKPPRGYTGVAGT